MPLDGLRCSRDSGSAHCDTPKSAVLGRPGGGIFDTYGQTFVNFAVPLFLFLSGYLTKSGAEQIIPLLKKRILRVCVPYVIWSVICYLLYFKEKSLVGLSISLLFGNACFPYYYIIVYMGFTILAPAISRLASSRYYWIGYMVSPLYLIIFRYLPMVTGNPGNAILNKLLGLSIFSWFIFIIWEFCSEIKK